jgi:polyhydroxyalkanoate synthesis repressor PhaR
MPTPAGERLVRRYGNRKLYDTRARRYATVQDLGRLVAQGQDVRVLDQETGEDLTTQVLAQAILEGIRERTARVPRQVLSAILRLGTGRGLDWPGPEAAGRARQEAERIVRGLLERLSLEEALALRQQIAAAVQRAMAEGQRGLEGRWRSLLVRMGMSPPPRGRRRAVRPPRGRGRRTRTTRRT